MKLLYVKHMMEKLQCSRASIYNYVKKGIIPEPFYLGKKPCWDEENVDSFLCSLKNESK